MDNEIQKIFSDIAFSYDKANAVLSLSQDQKLRKKLIDLVDQKPNIQALDLCAGTLECTKVLLKKFPNIKITAIDFSDKMLQVGINKLTDTESKQINILTADVLTVNLPDHTYDAIVCAWGIRNVSDKAKFIKNAKRWIKQNGQLLILDFFKPTNLLKKLMIKTGSLFVPAIGGLITKNKNAYTYLMKSIGETQSVDEFSKILEENGFKIKNIYKSFFEIFSLLDIRLS